MNYRNTIVLCALMLCATSCDEDSLREEAFTFQAPQDFYSNFSEVQAATNGIYDGLMTYDMWVHPAWVSVCLENADMLSVNWFGGGYEGQQNGSWYIERPWKGFYQVLNRANTVIARVEALDFLSEEQANTVLGQAYFLRGYCYYEIARRFGDAIIRTTPYNPATDSPDIERMPRVEVYLQAARDLETAAGLLPANFSSGGYDESDRGRPTAPAAYGLQTKVYMHLAGAEIKETAYYADAIASAKKVMDAAASGFPALENEYMTIFQQATQDASNEILFTIQATQAPNEGPELPRFYVPGNTSFAGGGGIGAISLREDFYETFEQGDLRVAFGSAIFDEWTDINGRKYYNTRALPNNVSDTVQVGIYDNGFGRFGEDIYRLSSGEEIRANPRLHIKKYIDEVSQVKDENGSNPIVLRYADVILCLAEAENEVNGPTATAYDAVNMVRQRAGLEDLTTGLSKEDFRQSVRDERRHELFGEFQRRFDLIRWGIWLETMNNANRPRLAYQELYPLATEEIAANALINSNNPGW